MNDERTERERERKSCFGTNSSEPTLHCPPPLPPPPNLSLSSPHHTPPHSHTTHAHTIHTTGANDESKQWVVEHKAKDDAGDPSIDPFTRMAQEKKERVARGYAHTHTHTTHTHPHSLCLYYFCFLSFFLSFFLAFCLFSLLIACLVSGFVCFFVCFVLNCNCFTANNNNCTIYNAPQRLASAWLAPLTWLRPSKLPRTLHLENAIN